MSWNRTLMLSIYPLFKLNILRVKFYQFKKNLKPYDRNNKKS